VVVEEEDRAVVGVDDGRVVVDVEWPDPPGCDWGVVVELVGPGTVVVVEEEEEEEEVELVVVAPESSAGAVVVVVEGSEGAVVVVDGSGAGSVVGVTTVVDVVAVPSPGSEAASAEADPAGTQTTATNTVVRAMTRRTRISFIPVSVWIERQRRRPHRAGGSVRHRSKCSKTMTACEARGLRRGR
jgi:hypothetical protein